MIFPFSIYYLTNDVLMSICLVLSLVVQLLDNQIAPTLSTCTVIGSSTSIFMVCNNCTMNFNYFTTSDSAMNSASVLDSTTLFIPLLLQAIGIPQKYMMYPKTLILVSLSLAKSLSLSAFNAHLIIFFLNSNLSPYPFVDNTCLITLYISFRCTGAGASIVFDSSLTGLLMAVCCALSYIGEFLLHSCRSRGLLDLLCLLDFPVFWL